MPSVEGVGARRAALQMLDHVLRRGQTLESAAAGVRSLSPPDHALAIAIAGETLRRIPDLDALIDSATRQRLPDDSKARMVLRLALAQKIGLGTPDHAVVATACRSSTADHDGWSTACSAHCCGAGFRRSMRRGSPRLSRSAGARRGAMTSWRQRGARSPSVPRSTSALPTTQKPRPMPRSMAAYRSRLTMCGSKAHR